MRSSFAHGIAVLSLLAAACPPAFAQTSGPSAAAKDDDPKLDCRLGFDRLVADAQALPGSEELTVPAGSQMRSVSSAHTVHAFTVPGHPAHPMIVRRNVFERNGAVSIGMTACGYGDKAASDTLVEDFKKLNERISSPTQAHARGRTDPARPEPTDPAVLFREALLGYCYTAVTGQPGLATGVDPSRWNKVVAVETKGGPVGLTANAKSKGAVIVDLGPESCFVQVGDVDSAKLANSVRSELEGASFKAVVMDDKTAEIEKAQKRRTTVFGVISETSDMVPVVVVHEFFPPAPGVVSGAVYRGSKGNKPSS